MAICTGKSAIIYVTSTPAVATTGEAMTDSGDHMRYSITAAAKRYWDNTATTTVKVSGVTVTTGFTIEYAGGNVVFDVSQAANPVTVDVSYFPYAKLATATGWSLDFSPKFVETTTLNDQATKREKGLNEGKATINGFHVDDTWFNLAVTTITTLGIVFHESGTYNAADSTGSRYEFFANPTVSINASISDVLKDTITLEVQGEVYYRSA